MAITWRNVNVEDFSGAQRGAEEATKTILGSIGALNEGITKFDQEAAKEVNAQILGEIAKVQTPEELKTLTQNGLEGFVGPKAMRFIAPETTGAIMGRAGQLLNEEQSRQAALASQASAAKSQDEMARNRREEADNQVLVAAASAGMAVEEQLGRTDLTPEQRDVLIGQKQEIMNTIGSLGVKISDVKTVTELYEKARNAGLDRQKLLLEIQGKAQDIRLDQGRYDRDGQRQAASDAEKALNLRRKESIAAIQNAARPMGEKSADAYTIVDSMIKEMPWLSETDKSTLYNWAEGRLPDDFNFDELTELPPVDPNSFQSVAVTVANQLGLDPVEVAAVMSWESGGTFDPNIMGGDKKQYMGLIQFSPDNRRKYGIKEGSTPEEWSNAILKYMEDRGFKPGMDIQNFYAAILRGRAYLVDNVEDSNGTSPKNAMSRILNGKHIENAQRWLGQGGSGASPKPTPAVGNPAPTPAPVNRFKPESSSIDKAVYAAGKAAESEYRTKVNERRVNQGAAIVADNDKKNQATYKKLMSGGGVFDGASIGRVNQEIESIKKQIKDAYGTVPQNWEIGEAILRNVKPDGLFDFGGARSIGVFSSNGYDPKGVVDYFSPAAEDQRAVDARIDAETKVYINAIKTAEKKIEAEEKKARDAAARSGGRGTTVTENANLRLDKAKEEKKIAEERLATYRTQFGITSNPAATSRAGSGSSASGAPVSSFNRPLPTDRPLNFTELKRDARL